MPKVFNWFSAFQLFPKSLFIWSSQWYLPTCLYYHATDNHLRSRVLRLSFSSSMPSLSCSHSSAQTLHFCQDESTHSPVMLTLISSTLLLVFLVLIYLLAFYLEVNPSWTATSLIQPPSSPLLGVILYLFWTLKNLFSVPPKSNNSLSFVS